MSNPSGFAPLSQLIPWPEFLRPLQQSGTTPGGILDDVGLIDFSIDEGSDGSSTLNATLGLAEEISFGIPGLKCISVVFGKGESTDITQFQLLISLKRPLSLTLAHVPMTLRIDEGFLRPVERNREGKWVPRLKLDGSPQPLEVQLPPLDLTIDGDGDIDLHFSGTPSIMSEPFMIGSSGVVVEMVKPIELYLSSKNPPPPSHAMGFRGIHIPLAKIYLPWMNADSGTVGLEFKECFIGSGGFSGDLSADFSLTGDLFGLPIVLTHVELEFTDNVPVEGEIQVQLELPFFDHSINVDLSIGYDGSVLARLSAVQPTNVKSHNGLIQFTKTIGGQDVFEMSVESLAFELKKGLFTVELSGEITPLLGKDKGLKWPSFEVRELSIDSKGRVNMAGG